MKFRLCLFFSFFIFFTVSAQEDLLELIDDNSDENSDDNSEDDSDEDDEVKTLND